MYLSKSKYCIGLQCKKELWLETYKSDVKENLNNESVLENGAMVGDLARKLFGESVTVSFNKDLTKMIEDTKKYLKKENIIVCEASFSYKDNFCSVDLLKKNGNNYELYEVKSSTEISEVYLDDVSYQYYVLTSLGYNIKKCCIVYINNKYYRDGELELDKLFNIEDVTNIAISKLDYVKNNIEDINKYMNIVGEREESIGVKCNKPYPCPYFKYCTRNIERPCVFDLASMSFDKKLEYYNNGFVTFKELESSNIKDKYLEQIEYELYDKDDYIDKVKIKNFINEFSYPLYFLDFETYQKSIPLYDNMNPYMQVPFQYSLHYIEYDGGPLLHKEFLSEAGIDPRRSLAESLINDIPIDCCVLAYNMSFEKSRIKELAKIFPDLSEHLLNIYSNIKDLMIPFQKRWYYTKNMQGSYSIKYVLPAMYPNNPELDYHNLPVVHNGKEASETFIDMENMSKEELDVVREGMLMYCGLDTYAMVKVYDKLKRLC